MAIRVRCSCGQKLKAPDSFAGRRVRCPACGTSVKIPRDGDRAGAPADSGPPPIVPPPPDPGPEVEAPRSAGEPPPSPSPRPMPASSPDVPATPGTRDWEIPEDLRRPSAGDTGADLPAPEREPRDPSPVPASEPAPAAAPEPPPEHPEAPPRPESRLGAEEDASPVPGPTPAGPTEGTDEAPAIAPSRPAPEPPAAGSPPAGPDASPASPPARPEPAPPAASPPAAPPPAGPPIAASPAAEPPPPRAGRTTPAGPPASPSTSPGRPRTPARPAPPARPSLDRRAEPKGGARRRRTAWATLALVAALSGAAVGFGLLRGDGDGGGDDAPRAGDPLASAGSPPPGPDSGPARPDPLPIVSAASAPPRPAAEPARFASPASPRAATAAELIGPNLILNPGLEDADPLDHGPPGAAEFAHWERLGLVFSRSHESDPVAPITALDPPDLGRSYVLGGLPDPPGSGRTLLRQAVDVSAIADRIDAGRVRYALSAWLGGLDQTRSFAPNDASTLAVRFRSPDGDDLADSPLILGPIDAGLLQSAPPGTPLIAPFSRSGLLPPGTRSITFELAFDLRFGAVIHATADALRFVLDDAGP